MLYPLDGDDAVYADHDDAVAVLYVAGAAVRLVWEPLQVVTVAAVMPCSHSLQLHPVQLSRMLFQSHLLFDASIDPSYPRRVLETWAVLSDGIVEQRLLQTDSVVLGPSSYIYTAPPISG